jgi:hypothetical protein
MHEANHFQLFLNNPIHISSHLLFKDNFRTFDKYCANACLALFIAIMLISGYKASVDICFNTSIMLFLIRGAVCIYNRGLSKQLFNVTAFAIRICQLKFLNFVVINSAFLFLLFLFMLFMIAFLIIKLPFLVLWFYAVKFAYNIMSYTVLVPVYRILGRIRNYLRDYLNRF